MIESLAVTVPPHDARHPEALIRLGPFVMTVAWFHDFVNRYSLKGVLIPTLAFLLKGCSAREIAAHMGWTDAYARTVICRVLRQVGSKGDRHAICRRIADELYADVPVADPLVLGPVRDAAARQRHRGGKTGGRRKSRATRGGGGGAPPRMRLPRSLAFADRWQHRGLILRFARQGRRGGQMPLKPPRQIRGHADVGDALPVGENVDVGGARHAGTKRGVGRAEGLLNGSGSEQLRAFTGLAHSEPRGSLAALGMT